MRGIDKGIRVANFLIDMIVIRSISFLVMLIVPIYQETILLACLLFLYYSIMEYIWGQTLGKMITKTKVIYKNGSKPGLLRTFMRCFWRLFPLDAFSYLFGTEIGIHDQLSSTRLTKKNQS